MKENSSDDRSGWFETLRRNTTISDKSWWMTFWLSLFLGIFGADRFYVGRTGLGFVKLATFGGGFLWWIADLLLLLLGKMEDGDGRIVTWQQ